MGRTKRKRLNRKITKCFSFNSLDHESEIINLNIWLKSNRCQANKILGLGNFLDTGRGVVAKRNIQVGDKLIDIPLRLMISVFTILADDTFNELFSNSHCSKVTNFQELLSFYLTFLKSLGISSFWYIYLQSLPQYFTVPYFLSHDSKKYLHKNIHYTIENQREKIESSFEYFSNILKENKSSSEFVEKFKRYFSKESYEWAYFAVNTRCVHIQVDKIMSVLDSTVTNKPANKCYNDAPNLALCPYLDMFNHSKEVCTLTKLVSTNVNRTTIKDTETLFNEYNYHLYSCNSFEKYSQVFICYGESNNIKLVTEYGFYIPQNSLDSYNIHFESLLQYIKQFRHVKIDKNKYALLKNHKLDEDIYIDCNGLSFNFISTMYILLSTEMKEKTVLKDVYSLNYNQSVKLEIFNLIKPFLTNELNILRQKQLCLRKHSDESYALTNCINIMDKFIELLLKVI